MTYQHPGINFSIPGVEFKMLAPFLALYKNLDSLDLAAIIVKIVIIIITIISFVSTCRFCAVPVHKPAY
jgi:hypothetical protein